MSEPYAPDLNLALIGNGAIAALVDPQGRINWCCWPRLDGDPIFHALLGGARDDGYCSVALDGQVSAVQRYLPNTPMLETILRDGDGGEVRVIDFCPRFRQYGRMFCPPMLVRRMEPVCGTPRIKLKLRPGFDYGAQHPQPSAGSNHLRYAGSEFAVRATTNLPLSYIVHEQSFVLLLPGTIVLSPDEPLNTAPDALFSHFYGETLAYWHNWVTDLNVPFDWQEAVIRAAITLKLCTYEDTGGVVAALTTSIPEAPGSGRNWDYRFCWLRDSFFTIAALNRLSATRTMEHYLRFVLNAVRWSEFNEIPPLFPIAPGRSTEEMIVPHLPGFCGDGPVRIGNAAVGQRQNDAYGAIILSLAQLFLDRRLAVQGDVALYRSLCALGKVAERVAFEPDAGIWEFRGRARVHSFSATMCWVALSRLALIAHSVGCDEEARDWAARAAKLRSEIMARIVTREGWISAVLDAEVLDASVLILPEIGFIAPDAPEFLATLDVVEARLMRGGFVLRYEDPDDFGLPETAFLLCSFWYVGALALAGRREQALVMFERILAHRNHVGLLSEDLAPGGAGKPARLWGNFPQTYSHVGLILCAMRLSRSWEEGLWRAS